MCNELLSSFSLSIIANPPRDHVFYVTIPSNWKQSNLIHHFRNYGPIQISWTKPNAAFVALRNREHSPILLKTISKLENFNIVSYADHQLSKNVCKFSLFLMLFIMFKFN